MGNCHGDFICCCNVNKNILDKIKGEIAMSIQDNNFKLSLFLKQFENTKIEKSRFYAMIKAGSNLEYVQQAIIQELKSFDNIAAGEKMLKNIRPINIYTAYDKITGVPLTDNEAIAQAMISMKLPVTIAGALMPDAHLGSGVPIGLVLATVNAVIPNAVGVDIGCRMKLSIWDIDWNSVDRQLLVKILDSCTYFGNTFKDMNNGYFGFDDTSFDNLPTVLKHLRGKAQMQLGSSGGGNHFVEFGYVEINGIKKLALLSHSGSRGVGFEIAQHYTAVANAERKYIDAEISKLAWLYMDHDSGREYWNAMELAGRFSAACHDTIHRKISNQLGEGIVSGVENHHNFAWKEQIVINGETYEAIVHRKGATPAQKGVMGIIPGNMAGNCYIVKGLGNESYLNSASHGAGRMMSRTKAKQNITEIELKKTLRDAGVTLIGAGLDEAPRAYKDIEAVMEIQKDITVSVKGIFVPQIVKMQSNAEE